jgi:hypothetical protein
MTGHVTRRRRRIPLIPNRRGGVVYASKRGSLIDLCQIQARRYLERLRELPEQDHQTFGDRSRFPNGAASVLVCPQGSLDREIARDQYPALLRQLVVYPHWVNALCDHFPQGHPPPTCNESIFLVTWCRGAVAPRTSVHEKHCTRSIILPYNLVLSSPISCSKSGEVVSFRESVGAVYQYPSVAHCSKHVLGFWESHLKVPHNSFFF